MAACCLVSSNDDVFRALAYSTRRLILEEAELIASTKRGKFKILQFVGTDQIRAAVAWLDCLAETDTDTETEEM